MLGMRLNQSQGTDPRSKTGIAVSVCQCANCGLIFPQPLPVPNHLSDHYGVPPEEYWTNTYFELDPSFYAQQIEDALRLLGRKKDLRALDIGVGIGKAVTSMTRAGFDVWGLEPTKPFFDKAKELTGMAEDRLFNQALEEAHFEDDFFHFISFGAVLEHLYDPAASIERAMRWLQPGGVLHIEVPSSDYLMSKLLNAFFFLRGTNFVTNTSPMHTPFHLFEFTAESFSEHGARSGYSTVHQYIDVGGIFHLPRFSHEALRRWMRLRGQGKQLTVWLRKDG